MWLSKYFVYFVIFSCMGWVYETIFCTVKEKKWDNRGFLFGPVCPIYGVGGAAITALTDLAAVRAQDAGTYTWQQVFLVSFLGSIVLEYATSWWLEKVFHAYWWDYSDMPLNIRGRVCLPCSIGFGLAGLLVVYVIAPFVKTATGWVTPIQYELFGLLSMAVLAADTALTAASLVHFEDTVAAFDAHLNVHMDEFVDGVIEKSREIRTKMDQYPSALAFWENEKQNFLEAEREAIAGKIAQERERFSRESLEEVFGNMGGASRLALGRVRGWRRPRRGDASRMDAVLAELGKWKERRKKRQDQ